MSNPYKLRGTKQPISFGVEKLDGYIVDATEETIEGEELEVEDKNKNFGQIFAEKVSDAAVKERKLEKSLSNHNDSSLAKIGGGGLLAARYDITAKQLSESKRQSKLLQKIAENTERQSGKSELLMK